MEEKIQRNNGWAWSDGKKWQWKCQFNFFLQKAFFRLWKTSNSFRNCLTSRCFPISLSFSLQLRLFMFLKTLNKHLNLKKYIFWCNPKNAICWSLLFFDQSKICFPPFEDFHLELYTLQKCFLISLKNLVNVMFNLY